MEPVSILSAAAAISAVAGKAWELGSFVRELCQGAKTVDGRVRRLESAITELARTCEHVQGQFESMSSTPQSKTTALAWDEHGALTKSIEGQVKDCRKTLRELRKLLIDLRPSGSSMFGRTSRHLKLQDRAREISDFSMRVKTHTDAMQMSLQIVIIKIAHATPDFLLRQLGAALEDLRLRLSRIENNATPSMSRIDVGEAPGILLLEHAREALRSGTTLYQASTAGSIADVELVTDNVRAARIKEWANSIDALRESRNYNSGVTRRGPVAGEVRAENVVEGPSYTPTPRSSADSLSNGPSASDSGSTNSAALAKATRDISLGSDNARSSTPGTLTSHSPVNAQPIAIDGADHVTVGGNEDPTLSPGIKTEIISLSLSSRIPSKNRTMSLRHKSLAKTTDPERILGHCNASGQDASAPVERLPEDVRKAKRIPFTYPTDYSRPLDRATRGRLIEDLEIKITGKLEALICTGERIERATLLELAAADDTASTGQSSNTTGNRQQERRGLALLLAVYFRDVYLIKPLVRLGFSPNTITSLTRNGQNTRKPISVAIALRCRASIQVLLNNGAKLPYTCKYSPWFSLLNHESLRRCPPPSVESIKRVIDLLMPHSMFVDPLCACYPKSGDSDSTCVWWGYGLLEHACSMPAELSHYGLPLVTYLLEYLVLDDNTTSRYTSDSPLCNAIFLGDVGVFDFLLKAADESTVSDWLHTNSTDDLSPLFQAMLDPEVPLKMVRTLLDKGASLRSDRWIKLGFLGLTRRQTAQEFALKSGRADLIALVKEHARKHRFRSAQRVVVPFQADMADGRRSVNLTRSDIKG